MGIYLVKDLVRSGVEKNMPDIGVTTRTLTTRADCIFLYDFYNEESSIYVARRSLSSDIIIIQNENIE